MSTLLAISILRTLDKRKNSIETDYLVNLG